MIMSHTVTNPALGRNEVALSGMTCVEAATAAVNAYK